MADIHLSGPSFSKFTISGKQYLLIFAKDTEAAGGGNEFSVDVHFEDSNGFDFSSYSWLGARGSSFITRTGKDGFAHSTLRICEDTNGPFFSIGMKLEEVGLVRFNHQGEVSFGQFQSAEQRLVLPFEGVNFDWPTARSIDAKVEYLETETHDANGNRFYFYAVPGHDNQASKAHTYLEIERGYPVFRFSSHSIFVCDDELIVAMHSNQRVADGSLSSKAYGYLRIPSNAERSIFVYNNMGLPIGTVQVNLVAHRQVVSFTNGDLSWQ